MRNLSFRGYAQNKGFDPLKVPDETWKLQDETERTLRGMREVRSQNLQNRNEVLSTLKENSAKEQRQRDRNQNLKTEFAKAYHDAEMQHYKQRVLDQDVKIREAQADYARFEKLKDLAPKAIMALGQFHTMRVEKVLAKRSELTSTLRQQLGDEGYDEVLKAVLQGYKLKEVLREKYPNYKQTIDGSLNGLQLYAAQANMVENSLQDLPAQLAAWKAESGFDQQRLDKNNTSTRAGNMLLDDFAKRIIESYKTTPDGGKGLSETFIERFVRPEVDALIAQEKLALKGITENNQKDITYESRGKEFVTLTRDSMQPLIDTVNAVEGKSGYLDEYEHYMIKLAETNPNFKYGIEYFTKQFNQPIIVQGQETTFQKKYPNRANRILKAAADAWEVQDNQNMQLVQAKSAQKLQQIMATEGPKHPSLYAEAYEDLTTVQHVKRWQLEKSVEGRAIIDGMNRPIEEFNTEVLDHWVKEKQESEGGFKISDIMVPTLSNAQRKRMFLKTAEGHGLNGEKTDSVIESALRKQMKIMNGQLTTTDIAAPAVDLLMPYAKRDAYKFLYGYFDKVNAENIDNKEEVVAAAMNEYVASMENNTLYKSKGLGKNFRYTHFDSVADKLDNYRVIGDVLDNGPSQLLQKDFLTEEQDQIILNYGKNGGDVPEFLERITDQIPNADHIDVVNMRRKANGQKPIERYGTDNLVNTVNTEYRSLFTNKPSFAKGLRGMFLTAEDNGTIAEDYKNIYAAFIPKDIGFQFDEPHEVVRTKNGLKKSLDMGFALGETDVTEISNLLNSGMASSVGAWDIDIDMIRHAKDAGIISEVDTLTPEVQQAIFAEHTYRNTGGFIVKGWDMPMLGYGQYHELPFDYKTRKSSRGSRKSRKAMEMQFNKNIKGLMKWYDENFNTEYETPKTEGQQLIEIIAKNVQSSAERRKLEQADLKQTSRGLKEKETRKIEQDVRQNIFSYELSKSNIDAFKLTDLMYNELIGEN